MILQDHSEMGGGGDEGGGRESGEKYFLYSRSLYVNPRVIRGQEFVRGTVW
jgi:hypothetical protein